MRRDECFEIGLGVRNPAECAQSARELLATGYMKKRPFDLRVILKLMGKTSTVIESFRRSQRRARGPTRSKKRYSTLNAAELHAVLCPTESLTCASSLYVADGRASVDTSRTTVVKWFFGAVLSFNGCGPESSLISPVF